MRGDDDSAAVDAGTVIPNITDGFRGRAPDLGAHERGDPGIAAIPCEVYGSTGLRLKAKSPLVPTFVISLAGGCEGYIPPPDQHELGGYTTWRARSSCLETQAEPKIVDALLEMLDEVAGPVE